MHPRKLRRFLRVVDVATKAPFTRERYVLLITRLLYMQDSLRAYMEMKHLFPTSQTYIEGFFWRTRCVSRVH